ncbi:unnamed protein product [Arctia plantaginis]|uniref:Pacifastin domain-containing protein n=1 Tax=Arctia plantaginis TaxID=874455 RepID=A0A8S1AVE2_ARCPL|nr:unnamed protein product [Arctia plantaginis]
MIGRRQACQPGQIIWEECRQCICQDNGKLLCTNTECNEDLIKTRASHRSDSAVWCTPFRSYYVNCTLCVCPASGKMAEARCATDSSCTLKGTYTSVDMIPQSICIPKVMYLLPCLHCLCSDEGLFLKNKCTETCQKAPPSSKRCIPKNFYRVGCNICRCPDNGSPDNNVCSKLTCTQNTKLTSLTYLRNKTSACVPNKYTKPRCLYCKCNSHGNVNEQACMEQECLKFEDFNYESIKSTCIPGEMVPTCVECFCPRSKLTIEKYCTRVCSPQNRLVIVEAMLKEKVSLIDRNTVKETTGTDSCEPNSLFLDEGRYCLCSNNGNTNYKHCTSVLENAVPKKPSKIFMGNDMTGSRKIDFNISCEPNTYIEFGCNSCYCTKSGKIDPKWCTSDDCEAKKVIMDSNVNVRSGAPKGPKVPVPSATCIPGSVSKKDCNFCICGSSGLIVDTVCTKNVCNGLQESSAQDLHCDPSSYYTVDCNMCYCPSDGVKNVEKCTKNQCEVNFLRTNSCTPGQMFSSDCNICVCPPNGEKKDKICTNRTCFENDAPWKKIFKISQSVFRNHLVEETTKNFEPCFPGEEFEVGCKVCVCPDMGLKEYASCNSMLCEAQTADEEESLMEDRHRRKTRNSDLAPRRVIKYSESEEDDDHSHDNDEFCKTYNLTDSAENKECTPGSEYIIKCRVCICPYMGPITLFCRPMPVDRYCEQAYPGFNFLPMGRRNEKSEVFHYPINSCHIGDVIQNECIQCLCTSNSFFECKLVDCNKTKVLEEYDVRPDQTCIPNQLYIQNLITCICKKDGTWPHRSCLETFFSLPSAKLEKHSCKPNSYVKIDCNMCRCGPDGNIIENRCTKNICEVKPSRRIDMEDNSKQSNVYSNCILKNWYSLAPCQFCYCVNENKLVCNTGHYYAKKLEVGQYNMEICGMDMLNEAMELVPEEEKYLRQGIPFDTNVLTATVQETTTIQSITIENNDLKNINTYKQNSDNKQQSSDEGEMNGTGENEHESGSDEDDNTDNSPPGMIDMGKNDNSDTKSDDNDDTSSNEDNSNDSDSKDDDSNEISVDITRTKKGEVSAESLDEKSKNQRPTTKQAFEDLEFVDNTLKINVPNVLNKVFQMALRKSMVSLNNETHCTPGETYMNSCNMCFCLKNGKELCTANKCPSKP